ncbi:hypothetical protein GS966_11105 [Rhodococcus hoagii]|nr:hypothetical protein [Prescottella equi]
MTAEDDEGQVDTDCLYVERDVAGNLCGSCLVGHGLLEVGVPAEFLDRPVIGIAELLAHEWGFDQAGAKVRWLEEVQNAQDTGLPWARAIEKADSEVEE